MRIFKSTSSYKNQKKNQLSNNKTWMVLQSLIKGLGYKTNAVDLVKKSR